jgi:hypothetical protein
MDCVGRDDIAQLTRERDVALEREKATVHNGPGSPSSSILPVLISVHTGLPRTFNFRIEAAAQYHATQGNGPHLRMEGFRY